MAIVALWAAVLIPMWLRRHDDDQARRIERHRVAMGTLARIADDPEATQGAAARRRRLVLAAVATIGALGTVAWIAGLVPGLAAAFLWLPLIAYLPAAVISERRARQARALRALHERRERRGTQPDRGGSADSPGQAVPDTAPATTARTHNVQTPTLAWDDVFDQTA